jgi:enamine deaminase RidA (YjgF/YER057c/UK114 family)
MHDMLLPEGWAKPIGYAHGIAARGRLVFIGGQIGWTPQAKFETDDFVAQVRQTLENIVAILAEAGGRAEHLTMMTWYLVDHEEYLAKLREVGAVYREVVGRHFPSMAVIVVKGLLETRAKVEIQAMAVIPD